MTITFENKHNGELVKFGDVKSFKTDVEYLGTKGFDIKYNDETFNVVSDKTFRLVMVEA